MPDYKDMLRRAIAAMPENSGAARRAVYEKARSSLVGQLRAITPPLPARDITQHRLILEDHIRVVEDEAFEAVRQQQRTPPKPIDIIAELEALITQQEAVHGQREEPTPEAGSTKSQGGTTSPSLVGVDPVEALERRIEPPRASRASTRRKSYTVRPTVFLSPKTPQEEDFVSAMMPFTPDFNPVYRSIRSAVKSIGWRVDRADSIWEDQVIIQDIFGLIFRSRAVICDFSTKNPNVLYEAGIAHTLGRDVVPIVQELSDLPFDLKHHRVLVYENTPKGRVKLRRELEKRLQYLKLHPGAEP